MDTTSYVEFDNATYGLHCNDCQLGQSCCEWYTLTSPARSPHWCSTGNRNLPDLHQQNVFLSLGASGSVRELSDQNYRVAQSQSWRDWWSGLQMLLGPIQRPSGGPGSAGEKQLWHRRSGDNQGSTCERRRQAWEHQWQAPERYRQARDCWRQTSVHLGVPTRSPGSPMISLGVPMTSLGAPETNLGVARGTIEKPGYTGDRLGSSTIQPRSCGDMPESAGVNPGSAGKKP